MSIDKSKSIFFNNNTDQATDTRPSQLVFRGRSGSLDYEIVQKQVLVANNQTVSDTQTNILWQLTNMSLNENYYTLQLNQILHDVIKSNQLLKDLTSFAQLFNMPFAKLNLRLTKKGKIEGILNQNEILDIWESLKRTELKNLPDSKESQILIAAGDTEFSDSQSVIRNSFLYQLFFPDLYEADIENGSSTSRKKVFKSNVFTENLVEFDILQTVRSNKSNEVVVEQDYVSTKGNNYIADMQVIYDAHYKPLFTEDFLYNYHFKITYTLFRDSGIIKQATCEMKESINNNFSHISTYSVSLKSAGNE